MTEQAFIQQHQHQKLPEIALLLSKHPELNKEYIISQINGIQKAKTKLPAFYNTPNIIYPSKLSMEQCSSEQTGVYKSTLFRHSGLDSESSIIDLTGGFGVDSYYFSKQFQQVTYVEQNTALFEVVQHNMKLLKADNIKLVNSTAEAFLQHTTTKADVVYIDPSRRNENQRVFKLDECTPNIIELTPALFKVAAKILVKTAPLLDIKQSLKDLKQVSKVWVVSVDNDCKEVLYLLEEKTTPNPSIHTINLANSAQEYHFDFETEESSAIDFSNPLNFLYEPNVSILKAGAFKNIAKTFGLKKLAPNTHLYTSFGLADDFPGRTFRINETLAYNPKAFKKLGMTQANVSCRNFKDSVAQVKQKLKLKDGGEHYLFAFTDQLNKPQLVLAQKA